MPDDIEDSIDDQAIKTSNWSDIQRQTFRNDKTPKTQAEMDADKANFIQRKINRTIAACREISTDFDKCKLCEFRFSCWTEVTVKPQQDSTDRHDGLKYAES